MATGAEGQRLTKAYVSSVCVLSSYRYQPGLQLRNQNYTRQPFQQIILMPIESKRKAFMPQTFLYLALRCIIRGFQSRVIALLAAFE